ncbi:hypothetical protein CQA86_28990, partial [Klebsiella pneumoniae]
MHVVSGHWLQAGLWRRRGFKQYKIVEGLVKKASTIYISTDYDREGEAIARS